MRAGLAQRGGSGRIGLGQQRPAGQEHGKFVVMDPHRKRCRAHAELGWQISSGGAPEAIAAAPDISVVLIRLG